MAHLDGALRRLQVVTLTPQLSRSTGIDQKVEALQSHDSPGVCALSKIITSAWSTQLTAERQRLALKSGPSARPSRPVARRRAWTRSELHIGVGVLTLENVKSVSKL